MKRFLMIVALASAGLLGPSSAAEAVAEWQVAGHQQASPLVASPNTWKRDPAPAQRQRGPNSSTMSRSDRSVDVSRRSPPTSSRGVIVAIGLDGVSDVQTEFTEPAAERLAGDAEPPGRLVLAPPPCAPGRESGGAGPHRFEPPRTRRSCRTRAVRGSGHPGRGRGCPRSGRPARNRSGSGFPCTSPLPSTTTTSDGNSRAASDGSMIGR
jgi:hypothetical protein